MLQIKSKILAKFHSRSMKKASEKTSKQAGKNSIVGAIISLTLKIIILGLGMMLILFPFYYMIAGSLMSYDEISDKTEIHLWPKKIQWGNFSKAFEQGYVKALLLTAGVTFSSIVLKIFVTILLGYAFSLPRWRGKQILWWTLLGTMMLPEVALLSGQFRMVTTLGWRNGFMLIASFSLPFIASIFSALMFRNAFEAIPDTIKEASMVDGSSELKYFVRIALPMITPTVWTVGILTAFAAWNSYMWPAILLAGAPGDKHYMMSTWLFTTGMSVDPGDTRIRTQLRLAAAIIAIAPLFITYFLMRSRIMKAISKQGNTIKG